MNIDLILEWILTFEGKPLYEVKQGENTRHIAPEQVSAEILSQLKADAEVRTCNADW